MAEDESTEIGYASVTSNARSILSMALFNLSVIIKQTCCITKIYI